MSKFVSRHIGPTPDQVKEMLAEIDFSSLDQLIDHTVPSQIRSNQDLNLPVALSEEELLQQLREISMKNKVYRSYIGMGFYNTVTPTVIQRCILENPGWYTQYTPYQAEISQGRLEALLNFQTMVSDLSGMEIANASLLDEGTAAAEAMSFCYRLRGAENKNKFFISNKCHPHVIAVVSTRAESLEIELVIGDEDQIELREDFFAVLISYPTTDGQIIDYQKFAETVHSFNALLIVDADILALAMLKPPGEFDADVVVGNTQRFGVPLGYGGPHAAYFATRDIFKREIPGRVVGVSRDAAGEVALRLAIQTREQHIRREKATSNICTAQVLLAVTASMYAVYHGPEGIKEIADQLHQNTLSLATALVKAGYSLRHEFFFDTLRIIVDPEEKEKIQQRAEKKEINLRYYSDRDIGVSLDQTVSAKDLEDLCEIFSADIDLNQQATKKRVPGKLLRSSQYLTHKTFNTYHSETEMLRYMHRLQSKDLSLTTSMIPLGSCTMKLNAASEMYPITLPGFSQLHPFVPLDQAAGYQQLIAELESYLCEITGLAASSVQPNAGSQGEYAGLLVIRAYHRAQGQGQRKVCIIPTSAHGTNPATAAMAGMQVVTVPCDIAGNVDLEQLEFKLKEHADRLAALMITYPSTHGVFEEGIKEIADLVHKHGGQVYMDGANLNAQVGLSRPGDFGVDVCHINLHKTFCIPHGGGGPGVGPICVAQHLQAFLPTHAVMGCGGERGISPVSSAPWGSASILPISWAYIRMMGPDGLKYATEVAILNANYIAARLEPYFPTLFRGKQGMVAHECILDLRKYKKTIGIEVADVAKRLMDYGFHAPTVSFPVVETLMVEPTESESKAELDRFCDAMIAIHQELVEIESAKIPANQSPLKNAPHTAEMVCSDTWTLPYTRQQAAYPLAFLKQFKFWPQVRRIDSAYGDRNLFCSCS